MVTMTVMVHTLGAILTGFDICCVFIQKINKSLIVNLVEVFTAQPNPKTMSTISRWLQDGKISLIIRQ